MFRAVCYGLSSLCQSLFWLERCGTHTHAHTRTDADTDSLQDRVNGRSWPYELGV